MNKKSLQLLFLAVIIISVGFVYIKFFSSNTGNIGEKKYLFIRTGQSYAQVVQTLKDSQLVNNIGSFEWVGGLFKLKSNIHPGRYEISKGMGNYAIVNMLKSGRQKPVKLVLNKLRTKRDIIKKLSSQLEADSVELNRLFSDPNFLSTWNIDTNQVQCLIMPATYELYWNTPAQKVVEKIAKAHENFWTADRRSQAKLLNLSIPQVITIASIVEEETNKNDEKAVASRVVFIDELKTLEQEIREISHDLNSEKTAVFNNFVVMVTHFFETQKTVCTAVITFAMDPKIEWNWVDNMAKINFYRILQEAFQNINKHANAQNVSATFTKVNDLIQLEIKDDGIGFNYARKKKGIGLQNMNSRINNSGGNMQIETEIGSGTLLKFELPLIAIKTINLIPNEKDNPVVNGR